jgi:hypothetical protein
VTTGVDNALNGQGNQRPNQILSDPYLKDRYQWPNPAAFQAPARGEFGNTPIHAYEGPGRFNVDMGLTRSFRIGGERQIQLRAEVFNLLNTGQLNNPVSSLNNSSQRSADRPAGAEVRLLVVGAGFSQLSCFGLIRRR